MKRDVFKLFLAWKEKDGRKPLVLMGARQVGKTWLMRDFGKRNLNLVGTDHLCGRDKLMFCLYFC